MDLIAVDKIRVAMPEGPRDLEPGDTLSLPDGVGKRLLELAPGRVRVVEHDLPFQPDDRVEPPEAPEAGVGPVCPFQVGQVVRYKFPTNIRGAVSFDWEYATGTIAEINHTLELATLYPNDEGDSWRMVPWVYISADVEGHGDGLS